MIKPQKNFKCLKQEFLNTQYLSMRVSMIEGFGMIKVRMSVLDPDSKKWLRIGQKIFDADDERTEAFAEYYRQMSQFVMVLDPKALMK